MTGLEDMTDHKNVIESLRVSMLIKMYILELYENY